MIGFAPMALGVAPLILTMISMPRDCLNTQLGAWRTGARHALAPDCMAHTAQPVPPFEIPASAFPAALLPPCGGVPASVAVGDSKR